VHGLVLISVPRYIASTVTVIVVVVVIQLLLLLINYSCMTNENGSGVVRINLLRFLAGCHKRRLNQVLSVLHLSMFLLCCCLLGPFLCIVRFCWYVFCLLVVLVKLRGCKHRPAPFPGRMLYKATKLSLVLFYILSCFNCVIA